MKSLTTPRRPDAGHTDRALPPMASLIVIGGTSLMLWAVIGGIALTL